MHLLEKINNITIGARLIAGFVIVTILMSSVGVIGFVGMNSIGAGMDKVYSDGTIPLLEVASIETSLNSIRALVFRTTALPAERDQDEKRMEDEVAKVDGLIAKLKNEALRPEEISNLTLFERQWTQYKSAAKEVFTLLNQGKEKDALTSIANGGNHANARRATASTFEDLKQGILKNSEQIAATGHTEKDRTIPIMFAIGVVVFIISLIFGVFLTRGITNPLRQVMTQFNLMTKGEISGRLNLTPT